MHKHSHYPDQSIHLNPVGVGTRQPIDHIQQENEREEIAKYAKQVFHVKGHEA